VTEKIYNEDRDTDKYESIVMKHMLAMTAEDLYSKAAIAVELAYRDWQIEQLREALQYALPYLQACVPDPRDGVKTDGSPDVNCVDRALRALEETK
jgi:hypothetical protein